MDYLTKDEVVSAWGEEFSIIANDSRVHFTTDNVFVDLVGTVKNSDGDDVKQVNFSEPNVSNLKMMDTANGEVAKTATLVASCTDIPANEVIKMGARDFSRIKKVIDCFF